jgi:hypothetical protein
MVRGRVRDRYLELQASRDALAALDAHLQARTDMIGLVSRRVDAGMLSARELGTERVAYSQLDCCAAANWRGQRAQGELAAALGCPGSARAHEASFRRGLAAPRRHGCWWCLHGTCNRLDVHHKLLEFGAAMPSQAALPHRIPTLPLDRAIPGIRATMFGRLRWACRCHRSADARRDSGGAGAARTGSRAIRGNQVDVITLPSAGAPGWR